MFEKLKSWLNDDKLFFALLLILMSLASFMLGRWSVMGEGVRGPVPSAPAAVIFHDAPAIYSTTTLSASSASPSEIIPTTKAVTTVVASRSGTKYHLPSCPGASQIKPENLVEFASPALAKAAGYSPAANCPDLPK